ncbi:MAG: 50S ribosomal protein L10 [Ruminococcaceae bacterium]|nr:50S ribosomal protein L10 [Oscillospiraceae bacterium]
MASAKILESKKQVVAELNEKIKNATAGVLVDYQGLTVEEDTDLRRKLREAGVEYKVIKNTLIKLALQGTGLENLSECLERPTALALANDEVIAAKVLGDYAKGNEKLEVKMGFLDGDVMSKDEVIALGKIPGKDTLIAQVACGLNSPLTKLAVVLGQVAEKQASEEA